MVFGSVAPVQAAFLDMPSIEKPPLSDEASPLAPVDIPPVSDRPPDPEAGPRVFVYEIKLQGVVEHPRHGITHEALTRVVEIARIKAMRADLMTESGFTTEEIGEISSLLADLGEDRRIEDLNQDDLQMLVALVKRLLDKRGLTFAQIEYIADQVTQYYRERGFFLAKAYVPTQEVHDGIVTLTVLEGALGDVTVVGNERYGAGQLTGAFDGKIGDPVIAQQIEEYLYLLNDLPGLSIYGYFKPGIQVGDTTLNLTVREEKRWSASTRLDNYGSELTGEYRLYGEVLWHNPSGLGDEIQAGVLQTMSPENSLYGLFTYTVPFLGTRNFLSAGYNSNQYAIDESSQLIGDLGLKGEVKQLFTTVSHKLVRSRANNWTLDATYARKESIVESDLVGDLGLSDYLSVYSLGVNFENLIENPRLLTQGRVEFSSGSLDDPGFYNPDVDFDVYRVNVSLLNFVGFPFTDYETRLITRFSGQYSEEVLPSVEQMAIAGAAGVRAFSVNTFSADSAAYAGVDWVFPLPEFMSWDVGAGAPLNRVVSPSVFFDYAYGEQNPISANEGKADATLSGWGVGLEMAFHRNISGSLQFSKVNSYDYSSSAATGREDDSRLMFELQYLIH